MGSAQVLIDVDDFDGAAKNFEDTYDCFGMDTKMHRFPAGLHYIGIDYPYIVPRVVAIGPYHHGLKHLQMMEVKQASLYYFAERTELEVEDMCKAVYGSLVTGARGKYIEDATTKGMTDDEFMGMMLRDACFLLQYMDAYSRSLGENDDPLVNASLRRFLFSNRDSIDNDIMLLENQLPWPVIQALVHLLSQYGLVNDWLGVVSHYILAMGKTFRVRQLYDLEPVFDLQIKTNPPPHLLALLRRQKVETEGSAPADGKRQSQKPKHGSNSPITPMELEEIGVSLKPSETGAFTDMDFVKAHLFHSRFRLRELSVTPLSLSETRASCLVNMAAFEVCTASRFQEDPNRNAVCSYIALLAMFMVREDDVHKLRSQGLLYGPHSNMQMLNFFKTVMKHLPEIDSQFSRTMEEVAEYKNHSYSAKVYRFFYNNLVTIIKVLSMIGTFIGLYQAILSLNKKK